MLKIRLSQVGKKHERSFRIVIVESRSKRDGKAIERIGYYNPKAKDKQFKIDRKRLNYWIKNGGQMTETVRKLVENN